MISCCELQDGLRKELKDTVEIMGREMAMREKSMKIVHKRMLKQVRSGDA